MVVRVPSLGNHPYVYYFFLRSSDMLIAAVNIQDLSALLSAFGQTGSLPGDINSDQRII